MERKYVVLILYAKADNTRATRIAGPLGAIIQHRYKGKSIFIHRGPEALIFAVKTTHGSHAIYESIRKPVDDSLKKISSPLEEGDRLIVLEVGDDLAITQAATGVLGFFCVPPTKPPGQSDR
jgi:hypothetical protein